MLPLKSTDSLLKKQAIRCIMNHEIITQGTIQGEGQLFLSCEGQIDPAESTTLQSIL